MTDEGRGGKGERDGAAARARLATILLVEDEEIVRRLTARVLSDGGYAVIQARNGNEALAAANDHPGAIDLVISDVMMPQMGGRDLVNRLRARLPGLRILLVSGYGDEQEGHPDEPRSVAFLEKPFTPEMLLAKVRETLRS